MAAYWPATLAPGSFTVSPRLYPISVVRKR
jgi:hypothetical protein